MSGLQIQDTLVQPTKEGLAHVIISNMTECFSSVSAGTVIGEATAVKIAEEDKSEPHSSASSSILTLEKQINEPLVVQSLWLVDDYKEELWKLIDKSKLLDEKQIQESYHYHHIAFCLHMQEKGETNLIEMEMHMGDKASRKMAAHLMPFVVHQKVAK